MTDIQKDTPVDRDRLDIITGGDKAEMEEFCKIYLDQAGMSLNDMRASLDAGDENLWKKTAHKLKGSSQTFGATPLSSLCYRAELAFKADRSEKEKMLADIQKEFVCVQRDVADILIQE